MPPPRSSRRQQCWTTSAFGVFCSSSRLESASRTPRSAPTSSGNSCSEPPVEGFFDPLRVLDQVPVVVPCRRGDRDRYLRSDPKSRRARRLLLGVAPPFPG